MSRASRAAFLAVAFTSTAAAQHGRVVTDTFQSRSLTNRLGLPPQTRVSIYLPPSYDSSTTKRYPAIYLLHGFGGSEATWTRVFNAPARMDSLVASGAAREMIIVMPSAANPFGGSFYANSSTTGNWDDFISRDLVAYVDSRFRTIAKPQSRGLAGHSMGGFGTMYLGIRHGVDVFGAMYAMSACCTSPLRVDPARDAARWDTVASFARADVRAKAGFYARVLAAMSAAFAPDSTKGPPFYDVPERREGDEWKVNAPVVAEWNAHTPALMLASARDRLRHMRGIAFDVGLQDELVSPEQLRALDSAFTRAGIPHTFDTYEGTHTSRVSERTGTQMLPFFSRVLVFDDRPR
jgi:S-formylglutathione hydrolase FrmB